MKATLKTDGSAIMELDSYEAEDIVSNFVSLSDMSSISAIAELFRIAMTGIDGLSESYFHKISRAECMYQFNELLISLVQNHENVTAIQSALWYAEQAAKEGVCNEQL